MFWRIPFTVVLIIFWIFWVIGCREKKYKISRPALGSRLDTARISRQTHQPASAIHHHRIGQTPLADSSCNIITMMLLCLPCLPAGKQKGWGFIPVSIRHIFWHLRKGISKLSAIIATILYSIEPNNHEPSNYS